MKKSPPVGSLFGYQILLAGSNKPLNSRRTWQLGDGLTLVTSDVSAVLEAHLRLYSLDSISSALAQITAQRFLQNNEFTAKVEAAGWDERILLRPVSLRRLMDAAARGRDLPDTATKNITLDAIRKSEELLFDYLPKRDMNETGSDSEIMAMALRSLQFQFTDQLGLDHYYRELALCLDTIDALKQRGVDLDAIFRAAYDFAFSDLAFLCFGMFSEINASVEACFNPRDLNKAHAFQNLPQRVIDAVFSQCAMTYADYKERLADPDSTIPGYEAYSLSPLIKWPLLIRSDGNAVAPIINDLFQRPFRGFLIDSLQAIEQVSPKDKGEFLRASGDSYETYVGESLSSAGGKIEAANAVFGTSEKRCDWVLTERGQVSLFEVKAVWVPFSASMTKERDRLKRALAQDGGLADAIVQLDESALAIRSGKTKVRKGANLIGLVVVRGDQVGLNSPYIRDLIEEILLERSRQGPIIKWQIMNDLGFSNLVRAKAAGHDIGKVVYDKIKHDIQRHDDMHFAFERLKGSLPEHPLTEKHAQLGAEMIKTYAPSFPATRTKRSGSVPGVVV